MHHAKRIAVAALLAMGLSGGNPALTQTASSPPVAVGAQYDTTHVYVPPEDFDRFVASFIATFGGHPS